MNHDVILDRYARLYEFPSQLARRGHDVLGLCLAYRRRGHGSWTHDAHPGRLEWYSNGLGGLVLPGLLNYPRRALAKLRAFRPDVLIAASDLPHVILGAHLARRLGCPFVADLYDDFESFGLSRSLPGARSVYRAEVRRAAGVICTSEALAIHVRTDYAAQGEVIALPSTVDLNVFQPLPKAEARSELGLPANAVLVGTAGGLHTEKGIGTLYDAYEELRARGMDVRLVLAGPTDNKRPPPKGAYVHYLGQLPHARTALLFNALDVGVIYLRDTPFGRFCFPQKAYEMLACGLPIVSARIGAMASLLQEVPGALYAADDAKALATCIETQLRERCLPQTAIRDWRELVDDLDALLQRIMAR